MVRTGIYYSSEFSSNKTTLCHICDNLSSTKLASLSFHWRYYAKCIHNERIFHEIFLANIVRRFSMKPSQNYLLKSTRLADLWHRNSGWFLSGSCRKRSLEYQDVNNQSMPWFLGILFMPRFYWFSFPTVSKLLLLYFRSLPELTNYSWYIWPKKIRKKEDTIK